MKKEPLKILSLILAIAVIPIMVIAIRYRQELRKRAALRNIIPSGKIELVE